MADNPNNPLDASVNITGAAESIEALRARESLLQASPALTAASEPSPIEAPYSAPNPSSVRAQENAQWRNMQSERQYQDLAANVGTDVASQRYEEWFSLLSPHSEASTSSFMRYNSAVYGTEPPPKVDAGWDSEAANARAASRPYVVNTQVDPASTMTAPAAAGSAFDREAYEQSRRTGYYVNNPAPEVPAPVVTGIEKKYPYTNNYASRVDEINAQRVQSEAAPAPSVSRAPSYSTYADAQQARADVLEDARNLYTARGDYAKIGTPSFNKEVGEAEEAIGLRAPETFQTRLSSPMGRFSLGYAAMQIGQESGHYFSETQAGQYLTPEQRETASAGFLPGAGAIAGTLLGAAVPAIGPMMGGMAGGAIGSAVSGVVGATDERSQATREAAERLAASLDAAAGSVGQFKGLIEATGAPVQQLGQGLVTLQGIAPGAGAAAIAGAGRSALSQGEYFNQDTAETGKFLAGSPALAPLASQYVRGGSELSRGQYQAIGELALSEGDMGAFNAAQMQASRASLNNDAAYQGAATHLENVKKEGFGSGALAVGFATWYRQYDSSFHNDITDAQDEEAARIKAQQGQTAADGQKYTDEFLAINQSKQGLFAAGLSTRIGQTALSTAVAEGASAATLRGLAPGINASLDAEFVADQGLINTFAGKMNGLTDATDPTGSLRTQYQNEINSARADQVQNPLAKAQLAKSIFDTGLTEEQSRFSLFATKDTLSGSSAASLLGGYDRQAEFLSGTAADPRSPLSPAERAGIEESAYKMRYQASEDVYQERQRTVGISSAIAGADLSRAETLGTPMDAYRARMEQVGTEQSQLEAITSRLAQTIPFAERQQLLTQQAMLAGQIATGPEQARISSYTTEGGILSDIQGADRAGLSRAVAIGGQAGYTPQVFTDDQNNINLARAARDGSPAGSVQWARFNRDYQSGLVQQQEDETGAQTFRETASERTADTILSGAQFRASRIGGAAAQSAALDTLRQDETYLSRAQLDAATATDPLAREASTRAGQGFENDAALQLTRSQTYSETVDQRTRDSNVNSDYQRAMRAPYMDGPNSSPLTRGNAVLSNLRGELSQAQSVLAKATDPNAILADTQIVNNYKDEISTFEHERLYNGVLPQEIEKVIGRPEGGIGIAIAPLAAATAAGRGPYNPTFGGFGHHDNPLMTATGGMAQEGGAFSGWWHTAGGTRPEASPGQVVPSASSGQDRSLDNRELVSLTGQMVSLLRQIDQKLRAGNGQQPPHNGAGVMNYMQGLIP